MKKKFFLWLVPFGVIWLSCCQKELKWHLCGTVVEYGTGKPIPNATVNLGLHDPDTGSGGGSSVYTKQLEVDADGRFCYDGRVDVVGAEAEGYYPSGNQDIFIGENNREDWEVPLYPYAWIKITIRNETGLYPSFGTFNENLFGEVFHIEKNRDTSMIAKIRGNREIGFPYSLRDFDNNIQKDKDLVTIYFDGRALLTELNVLSTGQYKITPVGHDTTELLFIY
jgi:hypothetical protein